HVFPPINEPINDGLALLATSYRIVISVGVAHGPVGAEQAPPARFNSRIPRRRPRACGCHRNVEQGARTSLVPDCTRRVGGAAMLGGWEDLRSAVAAPPNKRLKLTGGNRLEGFRVLCPWRGTDCRPPSSRRRASRPQLKRDPLGGSPTMSTVRLSLWTAPPTMDIAAPQPAFARDGDRVWLAYRTHRGDHFAVLRFDGVREFSF